MQIDLDIGRPTWDLALMARPAALQQDWSYGDAVRALGGTVLRAGLVADGVLIGVAQFTSRKIAGVVDMALCTRGPGLAGGGATRCESGCLPRAQARAGPGSAENCPVFPG